MSAKAPSRVIFIGNIPFDLTEEQLTDIFREVGPITNFRLMFDSDTGKPRGFAFCEYADADTAASAIRNLNGFDVGGRHLKVDYAESDMPRGPAPPPPRHLHTLQPTQSQEGGGGGVYANSLDDINATLASMSNQQLVDLIAQTKALAIANPEQARLMLQANPQVTFALFQAMLLTNLVEQRVVQQIMHSLPAPMRQPAAQPAMPRTPSQPPGSQAMDQQEVIKQIMGLSEEQISALPREQQDQVRAFRAQYGGGGGGMK